jgi:hypothetical protein
VSGVALKRCTKCGEETAREGFGCDLRNRDGLESWCRRCKAVLRRAYQAANREKYKYNPAKYNKDRRSAQHLRLKYGITLADKSAMLAAQGGVCAICKESNWGKQGPCVDHCHKTGKVRQILCRDCNLIIGIAKDDERRLGAATHYLRRHRAANSDTTTTSEPVQRNLFSQNP